MTGCANLTGRVDTTGLLSRVSREHQTAFTIEHTNTIDTLLIGNRMHDLVGSLAIVVEHGVPCRTGDSARELVGAQDHGVDKLLFLTSEIEITTYAADGDNQNRERQNKFGPEFSWHGGARPVTG